jgi:hypothetical protein
MKMIQIGADAA